MVQLRSRSNRTGRRRRFQYELARMGLVVPHAPRTEGRSRPKRKGPAGTSESPANRPRAPGDTDAGPVSFGEAFQFLTLMG
jgi:hypothetical protein